MQIKSRITLLVVGILASIMLTACGPIYDTSYTYDPPMSGIGRNCIAQCGSARATCRFACKTEKAICKLNERERARMRFTSYKAERRSLHQSVDRTVDDFYHSYACNERCNCDNDYRDCYTTCGGRVLVHRQCVAF